MPKILNEAYFANGIETYPQDRIDFVEEMLEGICNGDEILNAENLDDQITTNLPPCLHNLVNDLKSLQNGKFGKIIKKFAGNNPVAKNYNWHLSVGNLFPSNAETGGSVVSGIVTTTLDNTYIYSNRFINSKNLNTRGFSRISC